MDTSGKMTKNVVIQWGESPTSVAYIPSSGQLLGWGLRAIEVRSAETGHLDGVFMHKREQRFKFLCERNDKVGPIALIDLSITSFIVTYLFIRSFRTHSGLFLQHPVRIATGLNDDLEWHPLVKGRKKGGAPLPSPFPLLLVLLSLPPHTRSAFAVGLF